MARLTNTDLHNEISLLQKDIELLKEGTSKISADVAMIKSTLCDPDDGTIARVNRNTSFRKSTTKALWTIYGVLIGILGKVFFWN